MEIEFSHSVRDLVFIQKRKDYLTMTCSGTTLLQVVIYVNILNFSIATTPQNLPERESLNANSLFTHQAACFTVRYVYVVTFPG